MEITLSKALSKIKVLNSRIEKEITSGTFASYKQRSSETVAGLSLDEFNKLAKASYDRINSLIDERNRLKSALIKANAETNLSEPINGIVYTIAEAIERKNSIGIEKSFLTKLRTNFNKSAALVESYNSRIDSELDGIIRTTFSSDNGSIDTEGIETFSKNFRDNRSYDIVNPLDLGNVISKMEDEIEIFETEIDSALSEINAITRITI